MQDQEPSPFLQDRPPITQNTNCDMIYASACPLRDTCPLPDDPACATLPQPPTAHFAWDECPFLVLKDCSGRNIQPIESTSIRAQLDIAFQLPLLFWEERQQWMWHKKWCLPRVHVRLRKPVPQSSVPAMHTMNVLISCGTIREGQFGLADEGLLGRCQMPLKNGEAVFSSLLFTRTSFNCGSRPFHLVVTLICSVFDPLTPQFDETQRKLIGAACYCSSPIHVDARKRSKLERPDAKVNDVRLMHRQRGANGRRPFPDEGAVQDTPGAVAEAGSGAAATMLALVQALGCTILLLRSDLVIMSVLSTSALGYRPQEMIGTSLLDVLHPEEHMPIKQTTQALLAAMAAPSASGEPSCEVRSVRTLHRGLMRNSSGDIETVVLDSTIAAIDGNSSGQLLLSIRYATPPVGPDSAIFRVFPANVPVNFVQ